MKAFVRIFLFILAFQVEVRVKASAEILMQPENCIQLKSECTIKVKNEKLHIESEAIQMHMYPETVLTKNTSKDWNFIKGKLWVEQANGVSFKTVFGEVKATTGEYWIVSEGSDKVWIKNITSDVSVTLRDGKVVQPPDGFEFWISGLNSKNQSEYGMINPIDIKQYVKLWYPLFKGDKESFKERVIVLKDAWGDLASKSSAIYKGVILRREASIAEEKQREIDKKMQLENEKKRILEIFRSKVFDR